MLRDGNRSFKHSIPHSKHILIKNSDPALLHEAYVLMMYVKGYADDQYS